MRAVSSTVLTPPTRPKYGIKDSPELHYQQTLAGGDFRGDPEKVKYYDLQRPGRPRLA